jgi:hypothetical protein
MKRVFMLGWDVGPWKCSGDSQDALQLLLWDESELSLCGTAFHGNLFKRRGSLQIADLLTCVNAPEVKVEDDLIIAIDAVFGWPVEFLSLTNGTSTFMPDTSAPNTDNRYLYRETERFLVEHLNLRSPNLPKTAVGDRLGTAATKVQHFLAGLTARGEVFVPPFDGACTPDDARSHSRTVIEVYPGATRGSEAFQELVSPHGTKVRNMGTTDIEDAMRCALVAACYAGTVGKINRQFPKVYLPSQCSSEQLTIQKEGWIFCPVR